MGQSEDTPECVTDLRKWVAALMWFSKGILTLSPINGLGMRVG